MKKGGGGGGGRCEIRNPQAFLFSFSHWHVKGFLSKRIQNCPLYPTIKVFGIGISIKSRCDTESESILFAGRSVHFQHENCTGWSSEGVNFTMKTTTNLLQWFENYLAERRQAVVLHGSRSDYLTVPVGVPQGSVLGPLLFLIYINDIVEDIESVIKLFADNTSMYLCLENPHI